MIGAVETDWQGPDTVRIIGVMDALALKLPQATVALALGQQSLERSDGAGPPTDVRQYQLVNWEHNNGLSIPGDDGAEELWEVYVWCDANRIWAIQLFQPDREGGQLSQPAALVLKALIQAHPQLSSSHHKAWHNHILADPSIDVEAL